MVEADHRFATNAHSAGLKRLSARANAAPNPSTGHRVCFSFAAYARNVIDHLCKCQVEILEGLSDEEFARVELEFGFTFPPDLRAILQEGLPVGDGFPNWRSGASAQLRLKLNSPISGLCFEVGRGRFWWKQWGSRPSDAHQAVAIARSALRKVPVLVPVYKHCYIPAAPNLAGNPVIFVDRKDVGYSGFDLADFFQREAFIPQDYCTSIDPQTVCDEDGGVRESLESYETALRTDGELQCLSLINVQKDPYHGRINKFRRGDGKEPNAVTHKLKSLRILLEGSGWKWEGFGRDCEARGKSLVAAANKNYEVQRKEALHSFKREISTWIHAERSHEYCSRSAGVSPRNSVSSAEFPRKSIDVISRHMDSPLSTKSLLPFTMAAPAWAAKTARHIEFWSDLVEKKMAADSVGYWNLSYAPKGDDTLTKGALDKVDKEGNVELPGGLTSKWVARYLENMAGQLRNGGWKENDISEMVDADFFPDSRKCLVWDRQSVLDDLTSKVNMLSISLKKAGWSAQEVSEALGPPQEKENIKFSPQFAAKVGKLTEYLARA